MASRNLLCLLGVAALFLPPQHAGAVEVLSAQELALHCEALPDASDSTDGQYCIRYIQGFIDGAVATDVRVMVNLDADYARKETFSERAIRTRGRADDTQRAAVYAEFCLGDPVPLLDVVQKIVADLADRERLDADEAARNAVYASLRKHYPCKKPAPEK